MWRFFNAGYSTGYSGRRKSTLMIRCSSQQRPSLHYVRSKHLENNQFGLKMVYGRAPLVAPPRYPWDTMPSQWPPGRPITSPGKKRAQHPTRPNATSVVSFYSTEVPQQNRFSLSHIFCFASQTEAGGRRQGMQSQTSQMWCSIEC